MTENAGVDYCHPQYDRHYQQWSRCDDATDGQDAIKAKGTEYLPKPSGQTNEAYLQYLRRANFLNATGKTIDALTGLVNAKPAVYVGPEAMKPMMADITLSGITVEEFTKEKLRALIRNGRYGTLVDRSAVDVGGMVKAKAEKVYGARPYARMYLAKDICNWDKAWVNGRELLTLVVLREHDCSRRDGYNYTTQIKYRTLELVDGVEFQGKVLNSVYVQKLWTANAKGVYDSYEQYIPLLNGQPMNEIPFRINNTETSGCDCQVPPILDLVDMNLAHYMNTADYEHGLHFTGAPQPYISGAEKPDSGGVFIGSPEILFLRDPAARGGYMEFNGQGLKPLSDAIAAKERKMAVLGARMLADEKAAAEAVEAVEMRFSGENSVLTSIANSVSLDMTWTLQWMAKWSNVEGSDKIRYTLNTDYNLKQMSPQMLTALVNAWQSGAITHETLVQAAQKGEVIGVWENVEKYVAKLFAANKAKEEGGGLLSGLRDKIGL